MLRRTARKAWKRVRICLEPTPERLFPLRPSLPLPPGVSARRLLAFLRSVRPVGAPDEEMDRYCTGDFRRFVYTYGLAADQAGQALELGANPYFTTMLLRRFTRLELTLANYFGPAWAEREPVEPVTYLDPETGRPATVPLRFHHFNVEKDRFPFADGVFDLVLCCEILEHLLQDPLAALAGIRRVLKPGGALILTTPNVCRVENVARLLAGENLYDPYSAYGPYGRHNREYTPAEVRRLLEHAGFEVERLFTADVHRNMAAYYAPARRLGALLPRGAGDRGQYIFVRARRAGPPGARKPAWLYRSYPSAELE